MLTRSAGHCNATFFLAEGDAARHVSTFSLLITGGEGGVWSSSTDFLGASRYGLVLLFFAHALLM